MRRTLTQPGYQRTAAGAPSPGAGGRPSAVAATSRLVPSAPSPGGVEASIRARLGLHSGSGSSPPSGRAGGGAGGAAALPPRAAEPRPWESSPSVASAASRSLLRPAAATPSAASAPSPSSYLDRLGGGAGASRGYAASALPPPSAAVATSVPVAAYLNEVDALKRSMAEAGKEWGATNSLVSKEKEALLAYSRDLEERNKALKAQLGAARIAAVISKASARRLFSSFTSLRDAAVDSAMSSTFALLDKERRSHADVKQQVRGLPSFFFSRSCSCACLQEWG